MLGINTYKQASHDENKDKTWDWHAETATHPAADTAL